MLKANFRTMPIILIVAFISLLFGCASSTPPKGNTETLEQLQQLSAGTISKSQTVNSIRQQGLQETALSIGAQAGLAARAKQINSMLSANASNLDRIFNFNQMMLDHNVLPPVLVESDQSLNLADNNTIRIAEHTYQIASQARFVTTPPTWRTYLWLNYTKPENPDASLLPQNPQERTIWEKYTVIGWEHGINQGNSIYNANLALLKRDYSGMIRYRALLAQRIVSAPFVAHTDLGITGGGSDMRVNDQVLRITALPSLQANSKQWKPVITQ